MAVIGGFRSDLSITCKTDRNFGNVSESFFVFQSPVSTKTVVINTTQHLEEASCLLIEDTASVTSSKGKCSNE